MVVLLVIVVILRFKAENIAVLVMVIMRVNHIKNNWQNQK